MATLVLHFINSNHECVKTVSVVGSKLSKTQLRKIYGKNSSEVDNDYYYIKKDNEYGIKWVMRINSTRYENYWTYSINGKGSQNLPSVLSNKLIVKIG